MLIETQPLPGLSVTKIGHFVEQGVWLLRHDQREVLAARGWVHELE
jgi:hypothetical protein